MSRCNSLYQALPNASASWSGCSWKRLTISAYFGSASIAMSDVSIIGACRFDGSCASGTVPLASGFLGFHCFAPAGLVVSSHSYLVRFSRYPLSHFVGLLVHAPSRPLVIVCAPLPFPCLFFHPRPCS